MKLCSRSRPKEKRGDDVEGTLRVSKRSARASESLLGRILSNLDFSEPFLRALVKLAQPSAEETNLKNVDRHCVKEFVGDNESKVIS